LFTTWIGSHETWSQIFPFFHSEVMLLAKSEHSLWLLWLNDSPQLSLNFSIYICKNKTYLIFFLLYFKWLPFQVVGDSNCKKLRKIFSLILFVHFYSWRKKTKTKLIKQTMTLIEKKAFFKTVKRDFFSYCGDEKLVKKDAHIFFRSTRGWLESAFNKW